MGCRSLLILLITNGLLAASATDAASSAPVLESVLRIVTGPSPLDSFRRPVGIAADAARGVCVIADTGNRRLVILDATGRSRGAIPFAASDSAVAEREPRSIALDRRGRIYIVDGVRRRVEVLTSFGTHLANLRPRLPVDLGEWTRPQAVSVGASGRIYLAYAGALPGVAVVEPSGEPVLVLGFVPVSEGDLQGPVSIAVNEDETAFAVVDPQGESAVRVYEASGALRAAFGTHGEREESFSMAAHAAWGPNNTLWVTDAVRHSVSVFDNRGNYLSRIGGFGAGPGQFYFPAGCAFLAPDRLVVLERAGARCQFLEVDVGGSGTSANTSATSVPAEPGPVTLLEREVKQRDT